MSAPEVELEALRLEQMHTALFMSVQEAEATGHWEALLATEAFLVTAELKVAMQDLVECEACHGFGDREVEYQDRLGLVGCEVCGSAGVITRWENVTAWKEAA